MCFFKIQVEKKRKKKGIRFEGVVDRGSKLSTVRWIPFRTEGVCRGVIVAVLRNYHQFFSLKIPQTNATK